MLQLGNEKISAALSILVLHHNHWKVINLQISEGNAKTRRDSQPWGSHTGGGPLCLSLVSGHKMCSRDSQVSPSCEGAASTAAWKNGPVSRLISAAHSRTKTMESQSDLLALGKDACR